MLEDGDEKTGDSSASARATSVVSEDMSAHLLSPQSRRKTKTYDCADALTAPEPPNESFDRPTSPDQVLRQRRCGQVVREDRHGVAPVASLPSAAPPPPPQQSKARTLALEQDEWEVRSIVGKRRVGKKGFEYKVRWKDTWLRRSELTNAQRLLEDFEARHRAHSGRNQSQPARADKRR